MDRPLATAFLSALEPAEPSDELERALEEVLRRAATLAGIDLPPAAFLPFLAERVAEGPDLLASLRELRVEDLAVAFGCATGSREALDAFERTYVPPVEEALRRTRLAPAVLADVMQDVRQLLFVATPPARPKIVSYLGRGDLVAWLKVTAMREAWRAGRPGRETAMEPDLLEAVTQHDAGADLELVSLRERFGKEFRRAFEEALDALPRADRTLLRYRYLDGLTGEEIASIRRVHRATVVRQLSDAHRTLLDDVRNRLREQLAINESECESLLRMARSDLEVSLGVLLANPRRTT